MAEPRVTALVTSYNYGEFIAQALDSVLAQEYAGEIDVLVVDDGSTDGSLEVLAGYGDRVRILAQENRGQLLALRTGLAAAGGDVVCLLDADDAWAPDHVATAVAALVEGSAEWFANGLVVCDERLRPTGPAVPPAGGEGPVPGEPERFLERRAGTATSGLAFRRALARDLVNAIDGLDAELRAALRYDADRILMALIGGLGRRGFQTDRPLTYYRRHGRQQFAGVERRIALLERQIEVDLIAARVMDRWLGWGRVPTAVWKHRLAVAALTGAGGRARMLARGLTAAARLAPRHPALAARQAAALGAAWLAPRRWIRRLEERQGVLVEERQSDGEGAGA